jgi:colanic acid/amylovoran biosynthesis glycosyltransferase
MKIAFIVDTFPTISHTFIINQITGLLNKGHSVDIYAKKKGDSSVLHADVEKYNLLKSTHCFIRMPKNLFLRFLKGVICLVFNLHKAPLALLKSLNVFKYAKQVLSLRMLYAALSWLDKPEYDIVHCHFGMMGIWAARLKELGMIRCPFVTTFHGTDAIVLPKMYGNDYYKTLFESGDLFTVSSRFMREQIRSLGAPEERVVRLPVGIYVERFSFRERKFAFGEKLNILTVARLVPFKGVEYSIRAVAEVAKKYQDLRYLIIGSGPLKEELENLAVSLGVSKNVEFLGSLSAEEIMKYVAQAHIFLLAGIVAADGSCEAQGLVLLEAQAAGIPVVSTQVGGIPESVLDGKSGFLVPQRDVDALAEKLCYLIEHPEIWAQMGRAGCAHVKANYDINKLNDQLVELYEQILPGRNLHMSKVRSKIPAVE